MFYVKMFQLWFKLLFSYRFQIDYCAINAIFNDGQFIVAKWVIAQMQY